MPQDAPIRIENMRKLPFPYELQAVVETEKCRVAQIATNLKVCTVVINSVEAVLVPLETSTQNNFELSWKV